MSAEVIVGIVTLLIGLPATFLQILRHLGGTSQRERLLQDIEIRNALHTNSDAAREYDKHIKDEALRLLGADPKRRDPLGITLAAIFLVLGVASVWFMFASGGWWWLLSPVAGFFLLFGGVGLASDIPKRERDARGRAI